MRFSIIFAFMPPTASGKVTGSSQSTLSFFFSLGLRLLYCSVVSIHSCERKIVFGVDVLLSS